MTEQEARKRWCPFVRITQETQSWHPITNREKMVDMTAAGGDVSRCIASDCMAWRWSREFIRMVDTGDGKIIEEYKRSGDKTDGFCGLGGKP